jgi:hypothetical protein
MIGAAALVALAFLLIALNYYGGLLLASVPFLTRVKTPKAWRSRPTLQNAGWVMIQDSIGSLTLLIFVFGFMALWSFIMDVLFPTYFGWCPFCIPVPNPYAATDTYASAGNWLLTERGAAEAFGVLMGAVPIGIQSLDKLWFTFGVPGLVSSFVSNAISPWTTAVNVYVLLLSFLLLWVKFIGPPGNFWAVFMIVGAFFYSFPARIGRVVGAWLIAVPISYLVAIPFLPGFVDTFTTTVQDALANSLNTTLAQEAWKLFTTGSFDFNTVTELVLTNINPATTLLVRLIFVGMYVGFIMTLSRSVAGWLAGASPPSIGAEPG